MLRSLFKSTKTAPEAAQPAVQAAEPPTEPIAPVTPPAAIEPAPAPGSSAAVAQARARLARQPDDFDALFDLGRQLAWTGQHAEAEPLLRRASTLRPAAQEVLHLLGFGLKMLGRLDEALTVGRLAVAAEPGASHTRVLLAQQLFLTEQYREGFLHFRARAGINGALPEWTAALPRWQGEALEGLRLFVWLDWGGIGDELMFARYVPELLRLYRPAELHWNVLPQNRRLLAMVPGVTQVFSETATLAVDRHIPLLELPCMFGTELDSIPAPSSYLQGDAADRARWAARLQPLPGLKVGLCWASGHWKDDPEFERDRLGRSVPLESLARFIGQPGISVISLQKGGAAATGLHDFTAELDDMAQTAALIDNLDLVVSVDTSVAHLAAALGKPVLLLAARGIGLFWGPRTRTPWYPTMRVLRQAAPGKWDAEIAQATALVGGWARHGRVGLFENLAP
ncbi:MAG: Tetratricopeptide repeat family protein [Betaproteobacteria bacterium]|nr:Tetratricopeptide repeat family protein [Betaproteobacteria bacterium]